MLKPTLTAFWSMGRQRKIRCSGPDSQSGKAR